MRKVLIVSAVLRRLALLGDGLAAQGYDARTAKSNAEGWAAVIEDIPDAVVIDTSMRRPELDPWLLCAEFSVVLKRPAIALVRPGRNSDHLQAIRAGVRNCLAVPVSIAEISSTLELLLGPERLAATGDENAIPGDYADEWLRIDLMNRRIFRGSQTCTLTRKEFELLQCLLSENGNIVPSEILSQKLWNRGSLQTRGKRLKTCISRLRKKVEADPSEPHYIISQHGFGYGFVSRAQKLTKALV